MTSSAGAIERATKRAPATLDGAAGRPLILVTNDDGIDAPGLWDLAHAVQGLGDVAVVAPAREQSWAGRAHRSDPDDVPGSELIRAVMSSRREPPADAPPLHTCIAVASTPARCVRLALTGMGLQPTLLLSGINAGNNGGGLLTTSGTLGAAWEAAGAGIPAIALSRPEIVDGTQTRRILQHVRALVARTLDVGLPADTAVLNVNFPADLTDHAGWVVTTTSSKSHYGHVMTPQAATGDTTTWRLQFVHEAPDNPEPGSDLALLAGGDVVLTLVPARHGIADTSWVPADLYVKNLALRTARSPS
jgi:5'-nucleotidase